MIIKEKNKPLNASDIKSFIENLSSYSDEEITKWLKAVKENGLSDEETSVLTLAMANSGQTISWEGLEPTIDKHSTGGIGDKITLLFVPLIAAYGIRIPKLSGRGLGISGGTIDKLESISGYRTNLEISEMKEQLKKIGLAVSGAAKNLAPADKRLYAIRDVTDTVESIPLIASSVMSKKIAAGAKNIILDVKYGSGAFMKDLNNARLLAKTMVQIGKNLNKNIKAVITNMNEPLGYSIGNSLEIEEVLDVLSGKNVNDLVEVTITLAKEAINLVEEKNIDESVLKDLLLNGSALNKFKQMVIAQGGNLNIPLPKAKHIEILKSNSSGYIKSIDALTLGEIVHELGAGRKNVTDHIDYSVGIKLLKKTGDFVNSGEPLLEIHTNSTDNQSNIKTKLLNNISIGNTPIKQKLIEEVIM